MPMPMRSRLRELDGGSLVLVLLVELDGRSRYGIARGILPPRCRASFQYSVSKESGSFSSYVQYAPTSETTRW